MRPAPAVGACGWHEPARAASEAIIPALPVRTLTWKSGCGRRAACPAAGAVLALALAAGAAALPARGSLDIYWIDVEGGAATLIVTPAGQSILMDAGWNRADARDAGRIQAALRDAGVARLDFFIASHFHGDHVGGLPALAARVPIGQFIDHGDSVDQSSERGSAAWRAYLDAAGGRRRTVRPGDKLPLRGGRVLVRGRPRRGRRRSR